MQLLTYFSTGENGNSVRETDRERITKVNYLADSVGLEASLEDAGGGEDVVMEGSSESADTPPEVATTPVSQKNIAAAMHSSPSTGHRASLCNALNDLKTNLASSPATTFNLANCAETNARTAEAVRLLEKYLEIAPTALDAEESHARIADLKALLTLPGQERKSVV